LLFKNWQFLPTSASKEGSALGFLFDVDQGISFSVAIGCLAFVLFADWSFVGIVWNCCVFQAVVCFQISHFMIIFFEMLTSVRSIKA